jgi:uncharacterized membrane protein YbhN (UPF0104 family)
MTSAPAPPQLDANNGAALTGSNARLLALKAAVTFALLAYLLSKLDVGVLGLKLRATSLLPVMLAVLVVTAEIPLTAARWLWLVRRNGAEMSYGLALKLTWSGLFFGQVLPASIGGDVVRGWLGTRNGLGWKPVVSSLVLDRVIALLAAVAMILCTLPWIAGAAAGSLRLTAQVSVGVVAMLIVGLFIDRVPLPARVMQNHIVTIARAMIGQVRAGLFSINGMAAFALSLFVHVMTIAAVTLLATAMGVTNALLPSAVVVPVALVAAAIPVSVNGWGVREGVMVAGFALFGIAQPEAFLISVLLGLSVVVSALPGGLAWLALK